MLVDYAMQSAAVWNNETDRHLENAIIRTITLSSAQVYKLKHRFIEKCLWLLENVPEAEVS